jgi:hypothetical protein
MIRVKRSSSPVNEGRNEKMGRSSQECSSGFSDMQRHPVELINSSRILQTD